MSRSFSHPRGQPRASTSVQPVPPATSSSAAPTPRAHGSPSGGGAIGEGWTDMHAIALDMVQTIASTISRLPDTFPVPSLRAGLHALLSIIEKIQVRNHRLFEHVRADAPYLDDEDKCRGRRDITTTPGLSCSRHKRNLPTTAQPKAIGRKASTDRGARGVRPPLSLCPNWLSVA